MVSTHTAGSFILVASVGQAGGSQPPVPGASQSIPTPTTQGAPPPLAPPGGSTPAGPNPMNMLWIFALGMLVIMLFSGMTGRKQKKQREAMLAGLKRNDRVLTAAGIVGTVAELGDQEVVLRVDETSNTRIRFTRAAIQQVLREGKDGPARSDVEVKPKTEAAASR